MRVLREIRTPRLRHTGSLPPRSTDDGRYLMNDISNHSLGRTSVATPASVHRQRSPYSRNSQSSYPPQSSYDEGEDADLNAHSDLEDRVPIQDPNFPRPDIRSNRGNGSPSSGSNTGSQGSA